MSARTMQSYFISDPGLTDRQKAPARAVELVEGSTLLSGAASFRAAFSTITTLESDLLRIAAAVFAADRGTERGMREAVGREISVSVPVVNSGVLSPLVGEIESALRFLSKDTWSLLLRQVGGKLEAHRSRPFTDGATLLFSGGLDSLAAAVEFGGPKNPPLQLVSHVTHNTVTRSTQTQLAEALGTHIAEHRQFFVSSRDGDRLDHDVESSQRTRSFVFLVLAALAARRTGRQRVLLLAENGQMAVHLPLTAARVGAFSTLTAHPSFLVRMTGILNSALGTNLTVENPYLYKTKMEVVEVLTRMHRALLPIANSCWRNARLTKGTHCGACVPCYIRRIAIEALGPDDTAYARDVWRENVATLSESDDGRRNLVDVLEFVARISDLPAAEIMHEWPELYSDDLRAPDVIAMYKRFAAEAQRVFARYPFVEALL